MAENEQPEQGKRSFFKDWVEPFLIAAVIALFIRQFGLEAFKIPSESMVPTLVVGDHLLVNKFVYGPRVPFTDKRIFSWKRPRRGEVIVFRYPRDEKKDFIKRIVGVEGDKVQIVKGVLFINDEPIRIERPPTDRDAEGPSGAEPGEERTYNERLGTVTHQVRYLYDQSGKNFGPRVVPVGQLFVMGDNRDNSMDSREWGFVKVEKVLGRAFIIYWSWDGGDRWVRWERIGSLIE